MTTTRDLDDGATLALLEDVVRRRREVEVEDLQLVLHFADLHGAISAETRPGGETLGDLGGDGTPGIGSLAVLELGIARHVHPRAAQAVVADALDLRHRLPQTWEAVQALTAEVWVARRVARMSRRLSYEAVTLVDGAVADAITGQSPARVLEVAEAKVIEADEAAYRARLELERQRRFVALSRLDDTGHRSVIARVGAGAAAEVMATVQEVADRLATREEHVGLGADELRAEAFAWLARPEDVLGLLDPPDDTSDTSDTSGAVHRQRRAVIYVHLSEASLVGLPGVMRVEGLGPHSLSQLRDLVGHDHVVVKPVIDLADAISVTAYEHPEAIKERIHLLWGGDAFPHATTTSRHLDLDHITSFDHTSRPDPPGRPSQTGSHTSQPLGRTPHRAKTHLGYHCALERPGRVVWTTPHGLTRVVDHAGTHCPA